MIGIVDSVELSKSKKSWRVKIGGKFYGAGLDSHLDGAKGKAIDFVYKGTDFGDWIESWGYSQGAPAAIAQTVAAVTAASNAGRVTEPELRFISNVVGNAIAAKTIVDPMQIGTWAKAAAAAVKEV